MKRTKSQQPRGGTFNKMPRLVRIPKFPRDDKGKAVPTKCPICDNGTLRFDGHGICGGPALWRCDGLTDPPSCNQELQACGFTHEDGTPFNPNKEEKVKIEI